MKNIDRSAGKNKEYFDIYSELICNLLSRQDLGNPAVKNILRFLVREASNCTSELPCYDNKLGSKMTSVKAIEKINMVTNNDYSGLVGDHIVPVSVINEKLTKLGLINIDSVKNAITKLAVRAVITKEEDDQLQIGRYKKIMPEDWGGNIFARYEKVGIELVDVPYKTVLQEARNRIKLRLGSNSTICE